MRGRPSIEHMDSVDLFPERGLRTGTPRGFRGGGPRERLAIHGVEALSDAELVELVLRIGDRFRSAEGLSRALLDVFGDVTCLSGASLLCLESVSGLGPAKASSLCAAFELSRRVAARPLNRGELIEGPIHVQRHFQRRLPVARQESFHVLLLDGRNRFMGELQVSLGTLTASLVHPREVFREAIRAAAAAIVVVHNHPSGDPSPSKEDREVTRRLVEVGELVGIRVLDHVIISEGGYFSFSEGGLDLAGNPQG